MTRSLLWTFGVGALLGGIVCVVFQWPPWNPPSSGDALIGSYYWLTYASYPLYIITGSLAHELSRAADGPLGMRLILNIQVVLNFAVLALIAAGTLRVIRAVHKRYALPQTKSAEPRV